MVKRQSKPENSNPYPADSWRSCFVLICAFLTHVLILGSSSSFGIFYPALLAEFKQDKAATALVDSVCFVTGGVLAPAAGRLTDRFGPRAPTVAAFLTGAVSFLTTSYIPNIYFMFATYSFLYGCVVSMIYNSVLLAVVSQFDKRRSLALGIISAAFGTGIFTMSPIIQLLLDNYGLRKTYRILAVVMTVSNVIGYVVNARPSAEIVQNEEMVHHKDEETAETTRSTMSRLQRHLKSVFVNVDFFVITISSSIVAGMGLHIPRVHLAKYAQGLGISTTKVAQLYLVNGVLSMIGRLMSGCLLDRQCINSKCFYTTASLIGGIATLLLPLTTTHWYLMVVNSVLGWVKGSLIATTYVIQLQIITYAVPKGQHGQAFGVCNFVYFVIASAGPPTAGLIVDKSGSYSVAFYMAGAIELFGTALVWLTMCFHFAKKSNTSAKYACVAHGENLVVVEKVSVL